MTPLKYLRRRRADYVDTFSSPVGERVLADLHEFCGAGKQSYVADPYQTAYNEGMRRVYLRIQGFLRMTDEQITRVIQNNEVGIS